MPNLKPGSKKKQFTTTSIESYIKLINKNCSQSLSAFKTNNEILFRGSRNKKYPSAFKGRPNINRIPGGTPGDLDEIINDLFSVANFKALRSNSIFCSSDPEFASTYGDLYIIFPLDNFDFLWSPKIRDFTEDFNRSSNSLYKQLKDKSLSKPYDTKEIKKTFNKIANNAYKIRYSSISNRHLKSIGKKIDNLFWGKNTDMLQSFEDTIDKFKPINTNDVKKFNEFLVIFEKFPTVRNKFISARDLEIIKNFFDCELKSTSTITHPFNTTDVIELIRNKYKYSDDHFDKALQSGNEICIHGEYYAFNEEIFGRIFQKLLFSK